MENLNSEQYSEPSGIHGFLYFYINIIHANILKKPSGNVCVGISFLEERWSLLL